MTTSSGSSTICSPTHRTPTPVTGRRGAQTVTIARPEPLAARLWLWPDRPLRLLQQFDAAGQPTVYRIDFATLPHRHGWTVHQTDLYLDMFITADERDYAVLDEDELALAFDRGLISSKLRARVLAQAEEFVGTAGGWPVRQLAGDILRRSVRPEGADHQTALDVSQIWPWRARRLAGGSRLMPSLAVIIVSWNTSELLLALHRVGPRLAGRHRHRLRGGGGRQRIERRNAGAAARRAPRGAADRGGPQPGLRRRQQPGLATSFEFSVLSYEFCSRKLRTTPSGNQTHYVLLLNPDTEVVGDAIARLIGYLEAHPHVAVSWPAAALPRRQRAALAAALPELGRLLLGKHAAGAALAGQPLGAALSLRRPARRCRARGRLAGWRGPAGAPHGDRARRPARRWFCDVLRGA